MGPRLIDTRHLGRERAIGVWELDGVLVDPGPESCLDTVLAGLGAEPEVLLLTHIHLDHAGATGALVERFPSLRVYVHERGAPHLIDPAKLIESARRIYGEQMSQWGRIAPVPDQNVQVLRGGETLELSGRSVEVLYAPGHASHHVVYLDRSDGTVFVGDVAGVRIPPFEFVVAPTPPPDIDLELWHASIAQVRQLRPARLALTHFGMAEDVGAQLDGAAAALDRQAALARSLLAEGVSSDAAQARFARELEKRIRAETDNDTAAAAMQASSPDNLWSGLERYWRKRGVPQAGKV